MDTRLTTFETTDGTKLKLRPVREVAIAKRLQLIEDALRADGALLDPPTRTVVALGGKGDAIEIPLTAESLVMPDDPAQTARNQALWKAHEDALLKLNTLQQEERVKVMLALGVEIEGGVPPLDEWRSEIDYLGVELPEHPLDQKAYYLMYIVLNDYDLNVLLSQLLMLNGGKAVTSEQVESFQAAVQSQMGETFNSLVRTAEERLARLRMARAPAAAANAGSEGVGNGA